MSLLVQTILFERMKKLEKEKNKLLTPVLGRQDPLQVLKGPRLLGLRGGFLIVRQHLIDVRLLVGAVAALDGGGGGRLGASKRQFNLNVSNVFRKKTKKNVTIHLTGSLV